MNKKGFTLVELITTFALASVIIILLINIVLIIKNIYSKNNLKTELIIEQSNLSNLINKDFGVDNLDSYIPCDESEFCYDFNYYDAKSVRLVVTDKYIKYGSYVYKAKGGTTIGKPTMEIVEIEVSSPDKNNNILVIKIPISNKLYPNKDFGLNIVYQYNSNLLIL